jgi:hypothetical protein
MQAVAQVGTAETEPEHGFPPQEGAGVITGGSLVVDGTTSVQALVGLAVTHPQSVLTAPRTLGASAPQELITHKMAPF